MPKKSWLIASAILVFLTLIPVSLRADRNLVSDQVGDFGRFTETPPPAGTVRPIAEFEPASYVLIRYPLGIPLNLVAQLANTARVICIVASSSVQNSATNAFNSAGVNLANVDFMIAATDSYWTRDYGPLFVFDGNGDFGVVDFRYNRPRPNDNLIPQVFATQLDLPYYGMNLYQTGGNYMTDGISTAAQTTIAYTENPTLTQEQVNQKMHDYLGIDSYHVLPDPNNTYIDHIDCWGKFLAPDKVLIRSVPSSHPQYNAIEQTAAYFAAQHCAWGYPYRVYRVNTPQNQPYTNSLILNKRVFVPIMGSSYDATALQAYQSAMPGYEIIGVTGAGSTPWESTDALHCRAHEVPDQDMLEIRHLPYHGEYGAYDWYGFSAEIIPHSGQALIADSVYVAYKVNQGSWQTAVMTHNNGNEYGTTLSGFAPGDTIRYYLRAVDQSGRGASHPVFAALDPHVFSYANDTEAPTIIHSPPATIASGEHLFSATVSDNIQVGNVFLRYRTDEGAITEIPMMTDPEAPPNNWWVLLDLQFEPGDAIFHYQIEAWDNASPHNIATYPFPGEWLNIPVDPVALSDDLFPQPELTALITFPNPFQIDLCDHLSIEYRGVVNYTPVLNIFNIKGQLVHQDLCPIAFMGGIKFGWNGCGTRGQKLPAGVYFLRLSIGSNMLTNKILIVE